MNFVKRHMLEASSEGTDLNIPTKFPCVCALQHGLIHNSVFFMKKIVENIWKTTKFCYGILTDL